jgi:hypothetical protein
VDDAPPARQRIVLSLLIAIIAGFFVWQTHRSMMASSQTPDSLFLWRGARIMLAGGDPYDATTWRSMPAGDSDPGAWRAAIEPLYYPLPALLIWTPFALGSFLAGSVAFCALGAFVFAFAVTKGGLHRAWLCGGVPFIIALRFGQWSTWLTAAVVVPLLAFLLPAKPNLGLPLFLARPSRAMVLGGAGIIGVSLLVSPAWPLHWYATISGPFRATVPHPIPVTQFGGAGVLVLLALLRWRRPEARLIALLACVPQLPFWADQLPLATVAESRREVIWTVIAGHLGFLAWFFFARKVEMYVPVMQPYALAATYLPALFVVLRRPNLGAIPPWIERALSNAPAWVRGSGVAAHK